MKTDINVDTIIELIEINGYKPDKLNLNNISKKQTNLDFVCLNSKKHIKGIIQIDELDTLRLFIATPVIIEY